MKKKKKPHGGITRYLRELSIVILGVGATFIISNIVANRLEKRDMHLYLNAVKLEMEQNMKLAREKSEYFNRTLRLRNYLISAKPGQLNADSINYYGSGITGNYFTFVYKSSAFDMFKASGAMRLIGDKLLLNAIWDCYASLEDIKHDSDFYMSRKADELFDAMLANQEGVKTNFDIRTPQYKRMLIFLSISIDLNRSFEQCASGIEETLAKF